MDNGRDLLLLLLLVAVLLTGSDPPRPLPRPLGRGGAVFDGRVAATTAAAAATPSGTVAVVLERAAVHVEGLWRLVLLLWRLWLQGRLWQGRRVLLLHHALVGLVLLGRGQGLQGRAGGNVLRMPGGSSGSSPLSTWVGRHLLLLLRLLMYGDEVVRRRRLWRLLTMLERRPSPWRRPPSTSSPASTAGRDQPWLGVGGGRARVGGRGQRGLEGHPGVQVGGRRRLLLLLHRRRRRGVVEVRRRVRRRRGLPLAVEGAVLGPRDESGLKERLLSRVDSRLLQMVIHHHLERASNT